MLIWARAPPPTVEDMFQRISNAFVAWRLYRRPLQDRIDLANDPAISDELVMLLAGDPEPAVRLQVAHRRGCANATPA